MGLTYTTAAQRDVRERQTLDDFVDGPIAAEDQDQVGALSRGFPGERFGMARFGGGQMVRGKTAAGKRKFRMR